MKANHKSQPKSTTHHRRHTDSAKELKGQPRLPIGRRMRPKGKPDHSPGEECNCALHSKLWPDNPHFLPLCRNMPWLCPKEEPPACNTGVNSPDTQPFFDDWDLLQPPSGRTK